MSKTLKPCPFCGGEAAMEEFKDGSGGVVCTVCKFQPLLSHASYHRLEGKPKAIEWWNRRTPDIDISPDRLQEICKAEAEGRVIVLPCKVGTPVFIINCDSVDCNYCERDGGHGNCPFITKPICPLGIIQRVSYGYNHINKPIFFDFNAAVVYKEKYCEQAETALKEANTDDA